MKERIRKLWGLALALVVSMMLLPATAVAVEKLDMRVPGTDPSLAIFVGGVELSDGEYLAEGASATTSVKPSGGYAYLEGTALTLHNYAYEGVGYEFDAALGSAAIYAECDSGVDISIFLEGDNYIEASGDAIECFGIFFENGCDLSIYGEGSLTLVADSQGIYLSGGGLWAESATLDIESGNDCIRANPLYDEYGDYDGGGWIELFDVIASLDSEHGNGIIAETEIVFDNTDAFVTVELNALSAPLYVTSSYLVAKSLNTELDGSFCAIAGVASDVEFDSDAVIKASTEPDGELGAYLPAKIRDYDLIVVSSPAVYLGGVGMFDGDYLAVGASATTATKPAGGYAYYEAGVLTLHDYEYAGLGYEYGDGFFAGMFVCADLEIILEGENRIDVTDDSMVPEGIVVNYERNVGITGDGFLLVASDNYALFVYDGSISFDGGTVEMISLNGDAASVWGDFIVDGGEVRVVSNRLDALIVVGNLAVFSGSLTANAVDLDNNGSGVVRAISYTDDFIVGDGLGIAASVDPMGELGAFDLEQLEFYRLVVIGEGAFVPEPSPDPDPAFTMQPVGGEVAPGEKMTISWAFNFDPIKTVLVTFTPGTGGALTELASDATSIELGACPVGGYYQIRGYYDEDAFVWSDKFYVTESAAPAPVAYTVVVSASPAEGGTASGGGTYMDGDVVLVEAVANAGYHFVAWTEDGIVVCTSAGYVFTAANRTLVAVFEADAPEPGPGPDPEPDFDIWVGGVGMNDGDYLASGASATTSTKPAGGYAYYNERVLTLSDYEFSGSGYEYEPEFTAAIYAESDLTILLEGESSLEAADSVMYADGIILVDGCDLAIGGGGSLSVSADECGIFLFEGRVVVGDVTLAIESGAACIQTLGDIVISSGTVDLASEYGNAMFAGYGNIEIEGDVTASSLTDTIYASESVIINAGSLVARSYGVDPDDGCWAVYFGVAFDVDDALAISASTEPEGVPGAYNALKHEDYDLIVVEAASSAPEPPYSDLWKRFPDVKKEVERAGGPDNVWYVADGWLDYVVNAGLMSGYAANGYFGPYDNITRGQVAVILYRAECSENPGLVDLYGSTTDPAKYADTCAFRDMKAKEYYTAAVNWAKAAGILTGDASTGYTTVRPNDPIGRQELCVMLDRYANGSTSAGELLAPGVGEDIIGMGEVADWARGSVNWCVNNGIIYGVDNHNGTYSMNPADKTWRSAAAKMFTVLMRDVL